MQNSVLDYYIDRRTAGHDLRLSALILPYFSTLKGIFHPGQRGFLLYPTILCGHNYSIYLPYTNYHSKQQGSWARLHHIPPSTANSMHVPGEST
jgi:hypothetical protein